MKTKLDAGSTNVWVVGAAFRTATTRRGDTDPLSSTTADDRCMDAAAILDPGRKNRHDPALIEGWGSSG